MRGDREIGTSGMVVSPVTFGAMGIGGGVRFPGTDDAESIRAIHAALDRGITAFDTAPIYGFGHSEEILGRALRGRRDEVVISTKCGLWWGDDEGSYTFTWEGTDVRRNLSDRTITIEVEESLRRLQTDYIDVYYTHNPSIPPFLTPIDETIDTLCRLRNQGKIRAIGASNCSPAQIQPYLDAGALQIVQRQYNVLEREIEPEILPLADRHHLTVHAYSPLARGLLSGAFGPFDVPDPRESRAANALWRPEVYPLAMRFVAEFSALADSYGMSPTALAIGALLATSDRINVICGIRRAERLDDVIAGAEARLDEEQLRAIRTLSDRFDRRRARVEA